MVCTRRAATAHAPARALSSTHLLEIDVVHLVAWHVAVVDGVVVCDDVAVVVAVVVALGVGVVVCELVADVVRELVTVVVCDDVAVLVGVDVGVVKQCDTSSSSTIPATAFAAAAGVA